MLTYQSSDEGELSVVNAPRWPGRCGNPRNNRGEVELKGPNLKSQCGVHSGEEVTRNRCKCCRSSCSVPCPHRGSPGPLPLRFRAHPCYTPFQEPHDLFDTGWIWWRMAGIFIGSSFHQMCLHAGYWKHWYGLKSHRLEPKSASHNLSVLDIETETPDHPPYPKASPLPCIPPPKQLDTTPPSQSKQPDEPSQSRHQHHASESSPEDTTRYLQLESARVCRPYHISNPSP